MERIVVTGGYDKKNLDFRLASIASEILNAYGVPVGVFVYRKVVQVS